MAKRKLMTPEEWERCLELEQQRKRLLEDLEDVRFRDKTGIPVFFRVGLRNKALQRDDLIRLRDILDARLCGQLEAIEDEFASLGVAKSRIPEDIWLLTQQQSDPEQTP